MAELGNHQGHLKGGTKGILRWATRAAQKIPENWEELCEHLFLRLAYTIKEEDIPSVLYINSNQTQVVYVQDSQLTWAKTGAKQISTVGNDEKHAFTIMSAPNYENCINAGFKFEHSNTKTYWLTHTTMHSLIDNIIAPYFEQKKQELGLPQMQKTIWQIDVWSVHRSEEFHSWMKIHHPTIGLHYVPGGCTGLFQPCHVGIQ
ncbi:hypothetical protein BDR06DRAFT_981632 [Suillus hirtellus]|nr:hypothetical protein BDR06DRAFT_981632 [Suillus hirtellus]